MPISVACRKCGKHYNVDPKLGGKIVRCKACSHEILVPAFESIEGAALEIPEPIATTAAPRAGPSQTPSRPCPKCGSAVPINVQFCEACGFSLAAAPRPAVAAAPPARNRAWSRPAAETRSGGYRITRPYDNPFLAMVDTAGTSLAQILYWLAILMGLINTIRDLNALFHFVAAFPIIPIPLLVWVVAFGWLPVFFLATFFILIPLLAAGVGMASRLMKFEVPEDPGWRALAAMEIALLFTWGSYYLLGMYLNSQVLSGHYISRSAAISAVLVIFVVIDIPVHFFLIKFFFRLQMLEAVMAYVFQFIVLLASSATVLLLILIYQNIVT